MGDNPRILAGNTSINSAAQLSKKELSGLLLPITTPFHADGAVNLDALRSNIGRWNKTGISGYVLLGSTGERVHLDEKEYATVIGAAREAIPDDLLIIVGAGQHSTRVTISEICAVAAAGRVDAALVITPHFYRPGMGQSTLHEHYLAVAEESPVPLILYSMPVFTGLKIEPSTAASLSSYKNIIGIKDSSADVDGLKETVAQVDSRFAVLTGNGTVLDVGLRAGACGAILAVGCVAPELCIAIIQAMKVGEGERAAQLQKKLTPLAAAVTTKYGIGGLKVGLDLAGYEGGHVRAPLKMPDEDARQEIAELWRDAHEALKLVETATGAD